MVRKLFSVHAPQAGPVQGVRSWRLSISPPVHNKQSFIGIDLSLFHKIDVIASLSVGESQFDNKLARMWF